MKIHENSRLFATIGRVTALFNRENLDFPQFEHAQGKTITRTCHIKQESKDNIIIRISPRYMKSDLNFRGCRRGGD